MNDNMTIIPENLPGKRLEDFFDKIKEIFEKGTEEKGIEGRYKTIPVEYSGFYIDLPRKRHDIYHGSIYEILCNKSKTWCKIKGDLVTEEDFEYETTKKLEESDCKIFSVHTHAQKKEGKLSNRESHIHFICQDRDSDDTLRMINFLKDY
jgi:hypothetical protein